MELDKKFNNLVSKVTKKDSDEQEGDKEDKKEE